MYKRLSLKGLSGNGLEIPAINSPIQFPTGKNVVDGNLLDNATSLRIRPFREITLILLSTSILLF